MDHGSINQDLEIAPRLTVPVLLRSLELAQPAQPFVPLPRFLLNYLDSSLRFPSDLHDATVGSKVV